ncbi:hypothetical protein EUGRSUZ_E04092 [Eucalyptus grandis]|uniref:Uncharacterized protein n=2 Tax=Eucalyptus grandis TaxID=71139 RepID=A0ACC3L093_EUCGR|nr:hypothetical protein EUGRSUZ_E04092 [Eucalyptus grandis]
MVESLQNLTLDGALNISALKLLRFCIIEKEFATDMRSNCPVLINAPNLLYFNYIGGLFSMHAISATSVLLQALMGVDSPAAGTSDQFASCGYKLLRYICCKTSYSNLQHYTRQYLSYFLSFGLINCSLDLLSEFNMRKDFLNSFAFFSSLLVWAFELNRVKLDSKALFAMLSHSSCLFSIRFGG